MELTYITVLTLTIIFMFAQTSICDIYEIRRNLKKQLLTDYHTDIVPMQKASESITVRLELYLQHIQDLDEPSQILSSLVHLDILWNDGLLRWNKSEYRDIDKLYFRSGRIWRPDIYIINAVNTNLRLQEDVEDFVFVTPDGCVRWFPSRQLNTICSLDVTWYPFDTQHCQITLESWIYDLNTIKLQTLKNGYNMTYYSVNGEWDFISVNTNTYNKTSAGSEYARLEWIITLQRRSLYHIITVLLPSELLLFLNFASFLLPVNSGEKVGYCVSLFLTMIVYLTLISKSLPSSSHQFSNFTVLIAFQLITSALITFVACIMEHSYSVCTTKISGTENGDGELPQMYDNNSDKTNSHKNLKLGLNKVFVVFCIVTNILALCLFFGFAVNQKYYI